MGRRKLNIREVMANANGEEYVPEDEVDESDNYDRSALKQRDRGGGLQFEFPHQSSQVQEQEEEPYYDDDAPPRAIRKRQAPRQEEEYQEDVSRRETSVPPKPVRKQKKPVEDFDEEKK